MMNNNKKNITYNNVALKLIKASMSEQMAYRFDTTLDLLLQLFVNGLRIVIVEAMMLHTPLLGGWAKKEIETLFLVALVMSLFADSFLKSVQNFVHEYHRGNLTPQILRPYSLPKLILLRWMKPAHTIVATILALPVFYYALSTGASIATISCNLLWGILSFILGVFTITLFASCLHLFGVFAERELPMDYLFFHLYRFSYWPIDLFPKAFQFFSVVMPVFVCSSVTSAFLVKGNSPYFYILIISFVFLLVLFNIMTKKVKKRLAFIGG